MGQARQRQAEIQALKAGGKTRFVPSSVPGFKPDAGLNSPDDQDSHYWFSVSEFAQYMLNKPPIATGRCRDGIVRAELPFTVDIMDEQGRTHMMPAQDTGYVATIDCSRQDLLALATEIEKGGMSVRITGRPHREVGKSYNGERWRLICPTKFWSAGNQSGNLLIYQVGDTGFDKTDSRAIAGCLRRLADWLTSQ